MNTASGALPLGVAHVPLCALRPDVVPAIVPPPGAMAIGLAHVPPATVVVVVLEVVVVVDGLVVLVVTGDVVEVELVDVDDVVLVVVGLGGGVTVRLKVPLRPPYPSTIRK